MREDFALLAPLFERWRASNQAIAKHDSGLRVHNKFTTNKRLLHLGDYELATLDLRRLLIRPPGGTVSGSCRGWIVLRHRLPARGRRRSKCADGGTRGRTNMTAGAGLTSVLGWLGYLAIAVSRLLGPLWLAGSGRLRSGSRSYRPATPLRAARRGRASAAGSGRRPRLHQAGTTAAASRQKERRRPAAATCLLARGSASR
jgi:hypothetical protein